MDALGETGALDQAAGVVGALLGMHLPADDLAAEAPADFYPDRGGAKVHGMSNPKRTLRIAILAEFVAWPSPVSSAGNDMLAVGWGRLVAFKQKLPWNPLS